MAHDKLYPKTCKHCGKDFMGRKTRVYCSHACSVSWRIGKPGPVAGTKHPFWKGGKVARLKRRSKVAARTHPEQKRARWAVYYACKKGKLTKLPCEVCGSLKAEAHHEDYSKKLDVTWLCKKHHDHLHKMKKR